MEAMPFKSYIISSCVSTGDSAGSFCAAAVAFEETSDAAAAAAAAVDLDSKELVMVSLAGTSVGAGNGS